MNDEQPEANKGNLIKENLRRAFDDKADEELPPDLMALIAKLKEQDEKTDKE